MKEELAIDYTVESPHPIVDIAITLQILPLLHGNNTALFVNVAVIAFNVAASVAAVMSAYCSYL